jgi:hypothetical protein
MLKRASTDLGGDVVEDIIRSGATTGGTGTLNLMASGGNMLAGASSAVLNAARGDAAKSAIADTLREFKWPLSGFGAAIPEIGRARVGAEVYQNSQEKTANPAARPATNQDMSRLLQEIHNLGGVKMAAQPDIEPTPIPIAEDSPMPINPIVSKFEGGQRLDAYPPPDKGSGATVATGIDLGQRSIDELKSYGLPDDLVKKLTPYIGITDAAASKALKETPLNLTKDEADQLDEAVGGGIVRSVNAKLFKTSGQILDDLPEEARIVVESLAHNFGQNLDTKLPTAWKLINDKDWKGLHDFLIKTRWKQASLVGRRGQEASILSPLFEVV